MFLAQHAEVHAPKIFRFGDKDPLLLQKKDNGILELDIIEKINYI